MPNTFTHSFFTYAKVKTKQEKAKYLREYHSSYRKNELVKDYLDALHNIKLILSDSTNRPETVETVENIVCCSVPYLIDHLGLSEDHVRRAYLHGDYEIDHLIPKKWFKTHPEYAHHMNHWSNLVIVPKSVNRNKSGRLDKMNPKVRMLMYRMELDLIQAKVSNEFTDYNEKASLCAAVLRGGKVSLADLIDG